MQQCYKPQPEALYQCLNKNYKIDPHKADIVLSIDSADIRLDYMLIYSRLLAYVTPPGQKLVRSQWVSELFDMDKHE